MVAKIHVASYVDAAYVPYLATMIRSAIENAGSQTVLHFYVLHCHREQLAKDRLNRLIERSPNASLEWVAIDTSRYDQVFTDDGYVSKASYLRLLVGSLLPSDIDRILLLDSDIIVTGDLGGIVGLDFGANVALAAIDGGMQRTGLASAEVFAALGISPQALYFNAGVLLLDLQKWRELDLEKEAISICHQFHEQLRWGDQCVLNATLHGRWGVLDPIWNLQTAFFRQYPRQNLLYLRKSVRHTLKERKIVHFTGQSKPWHLDCDHPLKHLYLAYERPTASGSKSRVTSGTSHLRLAEQWNGWLKLKFKLGLLYRQHALPWKGEWLDMVQGVLTLCVKEPWYLFFAPMSLLRLRIERAVRAGSR